MPRVSRKYATMGLRREKNLSDVASSTTALNNLLNNLVNDPDPTKTFISDDLNAIRTLQASNIIADKLKTLKGNTTQYSVLAQNLEYLKLATSITVTGNTVTVTMSANHNLITNDFIYIANSANALVDGAHRVTFVSNTVVTFTIDNTIGLSGEQLIKVISVSGDSVNPRSMVTVTTNIPHGLSIGDTISITGSAAANANGSFDIETVPTVNTFTYTARGLVRGESFNTATTSDINTVVTETKVVDVPVSPLVTLKDRIYNAKIITGPVPAYQGGQGLLARFVPSGSIRVGSPSSTGESGSVFDINSNQLTEEYWDSGYFSFPSFIDKSFSDTYGGIQWTGYFSPRVFDSSPTINFTTTGLFIFEYYTNGAWEVGKSWYAAARPVTTSAVSYLPAGTSNTVVPITQDNLKYVGVDDLLASLGTITVESVTRATTLTGTDIIVLTGNQAVSGGKINFYDTTYKMVRTVNYTSSSVVGGKTRLVLASGAAKYINAGYNVVTFYKNSANEDLKVLEFSPSQASPTTPIGIILNGSITTNFTLGQSILFVKTVGSTQTGGSVTMPPVEPAGKIPVRWTMWWPKNFEQMADKSADFSYIDDQLSFAYLYTQQPSSTFSPYELRQFLTELISPTQTEIGKAKTSINGDNEESLYVSNTYLATWKPKSSFASIKKAGPIDVTFRNDQRLFFASSSLSGVERGSVIVPANGARLTTKIDSLIQVQDLMSGTVGIQTSILTNTLPALQYATGSISGTTLTVPGGGLTSKNVNCTVVGTGVTANTKITAVTNGTTATVSISQTVASTKLVFASTESVNFIDHRGFVDWFYIDAVANSTTITLLGGRNVSKLKKGYIVISASTAESGASAYTRITSSPEYSKTSTTLTLSRPLSASALTGEIVYIYADRGLVDMSKDVICEGTLGQVAPLEIPTNSSRFAVNDASGVTAGLLVYYGTSFQSGTVVSSVSGNTSTTTVSATISGTTMTVAAGGLTSAFVGMRVSGGSVAVNTFITAVTSATTATVSVSNSIATATTLTLYPGILISAPTITTIPGSSTIVFAPSNAYNSVNREGCVIPKDTAPPFSGTDVGLKTNTNVGVKSTQSTFKVSAISLSATIPSETDASPHIAAAGSPVTFNRKIQITCRGTTYSILAKKF